MLFALINATGIVRQAVRAGQVPVSLAISSANLTIIILSLALLVIAVIMILLMIARRPIGVGDKSGRPDAERAETQPAAAPATTGQAVPAADDPVLIAVITAAITAFKEDQASRQPQSTAGFIVRRVRRV